jgi:hypothetical protein
MGHPRFDFWLAEPLHNATRYARRHHRDGLCLSCSRVALPGFARCLRHLVSAAKAGRRFRRRAKLTAAGHDGEKTAVAPVSPLSGSGLLDGGGETNQSY